MQGGAWVGLLRRIPAAQHDSLVLMTSTGAEIVMQRMIRLDRDYLVCLGRLAGSTDQGKLLVIPYDAIIYLCFSKKMTDAEIHDVVGKPGVAVQIVETAPEPVTAQAAPVAVVETVDFPQSPVAAPTPATEPPAEVVTGLTTTIPAAAAEQQAKVEPPSKAILLARLRQRLANDVAKHNGGA
jgi:hypothetical protein